METESRIIVIPEVAIGESYDWSYRYLDVKNKIILEFGADIGSSASWFLRHGARNVYSVEGNRAWFDQLVKNAEKMDRRCCPIYSFITSSRQIQAIMDSVGKIDLLHMDIEGAEKYLLDLTDEVWKRIDQYSIEVHKELGLLLNFVERFIRLNYEVKVYTLDPLHNGWVLYASRIDPKNQCTFEEGYRI